MLLLLTAWGRTFQQSFTAKFSPSNAVLLNLSLLKLVVALKCLRAEASRCSAAFDLTCKFVSRTA